MISNNDLYKKYPNVLPGSIEEVPYGKKVMCGKDHTIASQGRICVIKCLEADFSIGCMKTRIININDLAVTKRCVVCVRLAANMRRRMSKHRT